ncbi:TrlF family AAA-like ATPase [Leifsonia sp. 71-9]|uniref:TrlF family AAA-like ATPase n=1 Tax=Leifsonia sp. 71-9 TaxID=1895934 RepID=UPI00092A0821|nr:MAG: hypothetical protein BGO91_20940 [Leifsonia sp. 71-9]
MHSDARGSIWRRWEPHIHTPGTLKEDSYPADCWDEYLTRIEQSSPKIEALGITDYGTLDRYLDVVAYKQEGRLPEVQLIFPNIELRFATGTSKNNAVNFHLLVDPSDEHHVAETQSFLRQLTFGVGGQTYSAHSEDLVRLGRAHMNDRDLPEAQALRVGAAQFKVEVHRLREAFDNNKWARDNILVGVAGGSDGTSGLQKDAGFAAFRQEIERLSDVIFAAQLSQREFWGGQRAASVAELVRDYGGPKPCLHGSDAHELDKVGVPDDDRFCWIKGDLTFESLRQACLEPLQRALVGPEPPAGAISHRVADGLSLTDANWFPSGDIRLNPGLVAIIGARGSGKTALADILANVAGEKADDSQSFLRRAGSLLGMAKAKLTWADGVVQEKNLLGAPVAAAPRVRYLSQQFVERLCSSEGISDELLLEIERVVFESHPVESRYGATSFKELLDIRAARARSTRSTHEGLLADVNLRLTELRALQAAAPAIKTKLEEVARSIKADKDARSKLLAQGAADRIFQLNATTEEVGRRQRAIEALSLKKQAIAGLTDHVANERRAILPNRLAKLKATYASAAFDDAQWAHFDLGYQGNPEDVLAQSLSTVEAELHRLTGVTIAVTQDPTVTIVEQSQLQSATLHALEAEVQRLQRLVGIDQLKAQQYTTLTANITRSEGEESKLRAALTRAEQASGMIAALLKQRDDAYGAVFDAIIDESSELTALYAPLEATINAASGTVRKLSFLVKRNVNVDEWASKGEALMDLRTTGPFRGHGALAEAARQRLLTAWATGDGNSVKQAMAAFHSEYDSGIRTHMRADVQSAEDRAKWAAEVADWLVSTDHISVSYGVQYEGINIEQLSPGTRGIVLLLLYLALDRDDERPLIIDQPEENLDPKSIYSELVQRFREARDRRQVIIVTHNANLVVNTDADQVIVATSSSSRVGALPDLSYISGGLENATIREAVCEILEGGREAFRDRARRLHVNLEVGSQ